MSSCPASGCYMKVITEKWAVVPGPPLLAKGSVSLHEKWRGTLLFGLQ